jgi:hypothetical protein
MIHAHRRRELRVEESPVARLGSARSRRMLTRLTTADLAGFGALAFLILTVAPSFAQTDQVRTSNCLGGFYRGFSCVTVWRQGPLNPHVTRVPQPISEQERLEYQQRDKRWQARCQPVVRQDEYGVPRYSYAARGCEFGRLD